MKMLERILVAVDFGPRTDDVVASAGAVAGAFGSEVALLHVLPELDDASPEERELVNLARESVTRRLAELRQRLEGEGVTVAETWVAEGTPFDEIVQHAEDHDVNVVVLGSRNPSEADGPRLGTTAERTCRSSSKPVWVVAPGAAAAPRSILCPVDCSSASRRALANAIHLARKWQARLVVLHAVGPLSSYSGLIPSRSRGVDQQRIEAATREFERFLGGFDFHGLPWEKRVRSGAAHERIVECAAEVSADLLVMGSVGRTGLARILMGSVASKVARSLPCSLVMLKAEDAIRLKIDQELSDLRTHYRRGVELLEHGFLEEARREFEHCVETHDMMFLPAWESLAETFDRLGKPHRAKECRETAQRIMDAISWRQVEADVRRRHPLWNPGGAPR